MTEAEYLMRARAMWNDFHLGIMTFDELMKLSAELYNEYHLQFKE